MNYQNDNFVTCKNIFRYNNHKALFYKTCIMKTRIFSMVFLGVFFISSWVSAMCLYEETDPVCSVSGETYTNSCQGWSDTSAWSIPKAYDGVCEETPELTDEQKEKIFSYMNSIYTKHNMKGILYWDESTASADSMTLNLKGQKFLREQLFPAIAKLINTEREKETPDTQKIAILNYVASMVGYDYYLTK